MRLWSSQYTNRSLAWGENTNPRRDILDQRWQSLSSGACWLRAGGTYTLGLYHFDTEQTVEVKWLDGITSRSGVGAFADLLQRGVVTFFKPGGASEPDDRNTRLGY